MHLNPIDFVGHARWLHRIERRPLFSPNGRNDFFDEILGQSAVIKARTLQTEEGVSILADDLPFGRKGMNPREY
jgi:hypothetical protein